jgi:hypothetical protein
MEYNEGVEIIRKKITMNKLVKCSAAAILAASLFSMSGQSVNAATGYQRLTHNAYAYTYSGKRANKKLYKKGSKVKVIGSITLNGKKYNIISGNVYIKASNFSKRRSSTLAGGYETQLLHNSYVYNAKGQRIKGKKLLKNHSVTCYGNPIRIHGKKYIQVGKGQFVRLSNVLYSYDGPTGSDSLNHIHHNVSNNTTKRNSSNSSTSTANNSSAQNSSSSTSKATSGNSTTSKSTSGSSTTDKKDSSKQDTSKKDSNKKDQSKSDSKTPSKSGDNKGNNPSDSKNTGKENSNVKPTQADYNALADAIINAREANYQMSSYSKKKIYDAAMERANDYIDSRNSFSNNFSQADIQKATSDLNTAVANLDWKDEIAKFPTIIVETDKGGMPKWDWTPAKEQQVLNVVNEIYGTTSAHFLSGRPNNDVIVLVPHFGSPQRIETWEFIKRVSPNGERIY